MLKRRHFIALSSAAIIAPQIVLAASATRHTLTYGPAALDIQSPPNAHNLPVMVFVHGGSWQIGNRTHVNSKPDFFNALGMVFVSIDYRLVPNVDVATQANDVGAAIAWTQNNIAQYGGNPNKIAIMGHSAGAHLAALAVISGVSPGVSALICNDIGMYDIAALAAARGGSLPRQSAKVFNQQSQWSALSPATYVGSRTHPATLLMWSRIRHHPAMAELFAQQLRAVGTSVSTFAAPDMTHAQINKNIGTGNPPRLDSAISGFLQAQGLV